MRNKLLVSFILRIGLAVPFLYAAVSSFLDPTSWIGFLPEFMKNIISGQILLGAFSIFQTGLALWLISHKKAYFAAIVACITILTIIVFNMGSLDILFRDIAILSAAVALAILEKPN